MRAHSALLEDFYHWDTPLTTGALSAGTRPGPGACSASRPLREAGSERITPRQIAHGHGDHYILRLNESIARSKQVVYIRLFPEMNGYWNPYCAYNADGSYRGPEPLDAQLPPGLEARRADHPGRQPAQDQPGASPVTA